MYRIDWNRYPASGVWSHLFGLGYTPGRQFVDFFAPMHFIQPSWSDWRFFSAGQGLLDCLPSTALVRFTRRGGVTLKVTGGWTGDLQASKIGVGGSQGPRSTLLEVKLGILPLSRADIVSPVAPLTTEHWQIRHNGRRPPTAPTQVGGCYTITIARKLKCSDPCPKSTHAFHPSHILAQSPMYVRTVLYHTDLPCRARHGHGHGHGPEPGSRRLQYNTILNTRLAIYLPDTVDLLRPGTSALSPRR